MPNGWIIALAAMFPNVFWMVFPPRETPPPDEEPSTGPTKLLKILEQIGRMGVFVVPFFYRINISGTGERICAGIMLLALAVYYAGWARYFLRGREYALLYKAMLNIPVPLAISPVVYFGAASLLLHSPILAIVAILLGVSHIPLGYQQAKRLGL